jgi:MFS family permease
MHKSYWLGLIGGFLGILGGAIVAIAGFYISLIDSEVTSGDLYILAAIAIFFSVLGIVGGHVQHEKRIGGILMIISGMGVLISISLLGLLTFILFLIGGLLMLSDAEKERRVAHPSYPKAPQPQTTYRGQITYRSGTTYNAEGGMSSCPNCGTPVEMAGQQTCRKCGYKYG